MIPGLLSKIFFSLCFFFSAHLAFCNFNKKTETGNLPKFYAVIYFFLISVWEHIPAEKFTTKWEKFYNILEYVNFSDKILNKHYFKMI